MAMEMSGNLDRKEKGNLITLLQQIIIFIMDFYDNINNVIKTAGDLDTEADISYQLSMQMASAKAAGSNLFSNSILGGVGDNNSILKNNEFDDDDSFIWDRCILSQCFPFQEQAIPKLLDVAITNVVIDRKGINSTRSINTNLRPANFIFLSSRYAHYQDKPELLENWLNVIPLRIRKICLLNINDMTFLSYWLSNCCILLYYFKKDSGLYSNFKTFKFQSDLIELINEIFNLLNLDVERRISIILKESILDCLTLPDLDEITYQSDWNLFHSNSTVNKKTTLEEIEELMKPPTLDQLAKISPINLTQILSSLLYVLDLFSIHPVIIQQSISQILFWIGSYLFNDILSNKKYLARIKAMQIRLNISTIEDWIRSNNRYIPSNNNDYITTEYDNNNNDDFLNQNSIIGISFSHSSLIDITKFHFSRIFQLLQWLQCFTGFRDDVLNLELLINDLPSLTPSQLIHIVNNYRYETGEKKVTKEFKKYLKLKEKLWIEERNVKEIEENKSKSENLNEKDAKETDEESKNDKKDDTNKKNETTDKKNEEEKGNRKEKENETENSKEKENGKETETETETETENGKGNGKDNDNKESKAHKKTESQSRNMLYTSSDSNLFQVQGNYTYLNTQYILPFCLPTTTEMINQWGSGIGGLNKKQAKLYEPKLDDEFLDLIDLTTGVNDIKLDNSNSINDNNNNNNTDSMFKTPEMPGPTAYKTWGGDIDDEDEFGNNIGSLSINDYTIDSPKW